MVDNSADLMYSKLPNLVIGFHGCNKFTFDDVVHEHNHLNPNCIKGDFTSVSG